MIVLITSMFVGKRWESVNRFWASRALLNLVWILVLGLAAGGFADESKTNPGPNSPGRPINAPAIAGAYYEAEVPDTLDLAERARLGLNHFTEIISEKNDYEMYWGVQKMCYGYYFPGVMKFAGYSGDCLGYNFNECNPPMMNLWWGVLQACQPKSLEAMAFLRLMSGSRQGWEREARMVEMMTSMLGDDGLWWTGGCEGKPWLGEQEWRPYANVGGQGRMMRAMIAWYQYTGDPRWKDRIDRLVDGVDRVMVAHKDDYAYFPTGGWIPHEYFRSGYVKGRGWKETEEPASEKGGEEGSLFNHQGHFSGALANWYLLSSNKQALRLSGELVRFLTKPKSWADWPGGEYPGVVGAEHAHWQGHFHGHINTLRAILEYAIATNDSRLKAFVRDGYEGTRQAGLARIGYVGDGQGCGCGRLIGLAVKLTYAGIGDYWEDVDLYIRNHGVEMQFTPEDIPYLKKLGEGKPTPPEDATGATKGVIEAAIGGYANHVPPYKNSWSLCCSPHGNMGLFYAWDGTLRYHNGVATVNLLLNRASPWMDVDSYLPYEGKVVLKNKAAREALVHIPLYVDKETVSCRIGNRKVSSNWFGRYLRVGDLKTGDNVTIEFPEAERVERWSAPPQEIKYGLSLPAGTVYTIRFKGNTVTEISPPLWPETWLYKDRPEKFKAGKAPLKKVTRYVSEMVLKW